MPSVKIVLGLGNPGEKYRQTRHNVGAHVVERLARRAGAHFQPDERTASIAELGAAHGSIALARPRTYMNRAGRAAVALCRRYQANPAELLVVYDDADLPLGRIRIRAAGGAGGHNGLRSLIAALGTEEFPRVRLGVHGVGREDVDLADYVLEPFAEDETPVADRLIDLGVEAVETVLAEGLATGMNRYNGRSVTEEAE